MNSGEPLVLRWSLFIESFRNYFAEQKLGSKSAAAPAGHGSNVKTTKVPRVTRTAQIPQSAQTNSLRNIGFAT
jgi:hypothetical protein